MSDFRIDQISNQAGTAGPDIAGITTFSSTSGMLMPSGVTEYRGGRGRGVFSSGYNPSNTNVIDTITISTLGNAIDFGDMNGNTAQQAGISNSTRAVFGGGTPTNQQLLIFSSGGSTSDFAGSMVVARRGSGGCSNSTRGLFGGGQTNNAPQFSSNDIDLVIFNSLGNYSNFGDLTQGRRQVAGLSSPTRGIFGGGYNGDLSPYARYDIMDYVTLSSLGNATDFGNLSLARSSFGGCSSPTRGLFVGGSPSGSPMANTNTIDFITIATLGDAQDFGDLLENTFHNQGATSSSTRGIFAGGYFQSPTPATNVISYATISTTGNAVDFGDLTLARSIGNDGAVSDVHGGLGD
jgi:hypothetical protein